MKKMQIFEPAMCCSTGLCGVGIDKELLRISNVLNSLKKNGIEVDRYNLNSAPQEFVNNQLINKYLMEKGVDGLPVISLDNEIVVSGRYPSNEEFVKLLDIPQSYIGGKPNLAGAKQNLSKVKPGSARAVIKKSTGQDCGCSNGDCC